MLMTNNGLNKNQNGYKIITEQNIAYLLTIENTGAAGLS